MIQRNTPKMEQLVPDCADHLKDVLSARIYIFSSENQSCSTHKYFQKRKRMFYAKVTMPQNTLYCIHKNYLGCI